MHKTSQRKVGQYAKKKFAFNKNDENKIDLGY